jgi:L-lactate dehydrogenase complex protein LldG
MNSSTARNRILERIRQALSLEERQEREYSERAFQHLLTTAPKPHESLSAIPNPVDVFIQQAQAVGAQVTELDSATRVPDWLQGSSFGALPVALSDQVDINALDWRRLNIDRNYAGHGQVGVVKASMAAAETGTVLLHSHEAPSGLLYLVDRLVILVKRAHIKARYEDLWADGLRKSLQGTPRAVHLITGPSRTADVEQTIQVGAHGPREVYIVVLAGG